jgi:predicted Zn-dependent peptidase
MIGKRMALACLLLAGGAAAESGVTLPAVTRVELDNGAVLLLSEKHDVPLVGVEVMIRGGADSDPETMAGLSALLAGLLGKGAGDRDAAAFAESVASVGATLGAAGGREAITVSGEFMSRDIDLMVELLADMLQRPTLTSVEFEKLRDRSINFIRAAKDSSLGAILPYYGAAFLFGEHVYGRPEIGSESSLARIGHRDLLMHYRDHVGADRLIIAVVGAFDSGELQAKLSDAFGGWAPAEAELAAVPAAERQAGRRVLLIDKPGATQTYFWLANVGVAVDYPRRAELVLANTVFGGRFTSMLNSALRVESGLSYGARSILTQPARPGSVAIYSFTETASTREAIDVALAQLRALRTDGIAAATLASAKNYLLGQFPPQLETAAQIARAYSRLELYGLDAGYYDDYAAAITNAEIETVADVIAEVYPAPEDLVIVLLGDAESIRETAGGYGPVTEIPITDPRFGPE